MRLLWKSDSSDAESGPGVSVFFRNLPDFHSVIGLFDYDSGSSGCSSIQYGIHPATERYLPV